ncbi:MAG: 2,3,4,5-tetrahydropyridine-2,6-dicarboxylate N-succinyltransferase [Planctomycetes bacterium]|nr:2,3,4,5-tetrahydropyridine-2,6-dicarboxylate N-succinyltransferase [Planctomycetota bacterium]
MSAQHEAWAAEIRAAMADPRRSDQPACVAVVDAVMNALDRGELRAAEPSPEGTWHVVRWVRDALLLYFRNAPFHTYSSPPFEWRDKVPLKSDLEAAGLRVVPPAALRRGAFIDRSAVLLPCFVNLGARIGARSMIDTWATIGSCAQIGADVHVSGGVGIGGVLEPPQERPVVIEDGAFIGSRSVIVEGVHIEREAVLGANVVLTASTAILDVTGPSEKLMRGRVPARAVVIPGTRARAFPAGEYQIPCALIVGWRNAGTDRKTALELALRELPSDLRS